MLPLAGGWPNVVATAAVFQWGGNSFTLLLQKRHSALPPVLRALQNFTVSHDDHLDSCRAGRGQRKRKFPTSRNSSLVALELRNDTKPRSSFGWHKIKQPIKHKSARGDLYRTTTLLIVSNRNRAGGVRNQNSVLCYDVWRLYGIVLNRESAAVLNEVATTTRLLTNTKE